MNIKTFILFGCIFAACSRPPAHVKSTDEVTRSFCEKMLKAHALIPLGSGGFFENKRVYALYADYEMFAPHDKEKARNLLLETVTEFIDHVNQDESIRPHLKSYPVAPTDVSISIAFFDQDHKPRETLAQVHLYQGRIYFSTYDPNKKCYLALESELY